MSRDVLIEARDAYRGEADGKVFTLRQEIWQSGAATYVRNCCHMDAEYLDSKLWRRYARQAGLTDLPMMRPFWVIRGGGIYERTRGQSAARIAPCREGFAGSWWWGNQQPRTVPSKTTPDDVAAHLELVMGWGRTA